MRDIEKVIELRDKQVASAVTLRKSMATATGAINKMKASAAAATFRKLLVASKVERKLDRDDGDGVDYDPGDQTHNSDNGTDQTRSFQTGLDALKTVVSAAKFRSKSENETMAALDDPDLDDDVKAVLFEREAPTKTIFPQNQTSNNPKTQTSKNPNIQKPNIQKSKNPNIWGSHSSMLSGDPPFRVGFLAQAAACILGLAQLSPGHHLGAVPFLSAVAGVRPTTDIAVHKAACD